MFDRRDHRTEYWPADRPRRRPVRAGPPGFLLSGLYLAGAALLLAGAGTLASSVAAGFENAGPETVLPVAGCAVMALLGGWLAFGAWRGLAAFVAACRLEAARTESEGDAARWESDRLLYEARRADAEADAASYAADQAQADLLQRQVELLRLYEREVREGRDLDGDGHVGRPPGGYGRPILVRGGARGRVAEDPTLAALKRVLAVCHGAGTLARGRIVPLLDGDEALYDFAWRSEDSAKGVGVLTWLGFVEGRRKGVEGRLVPFDAPADAVAELGRLWEEGASEYVNNAGAGAETVAVAGQAGGRQAVTET